MDDDWGYHPISITTITLSHPHVGSSVECRVCLGLFLHSAIHQKHHKHCSLFFAWRSSFVWDQNRWTYKKGIPMDRVFTLQRWFWKCWAITKLEPNSFRFGMFTSMKNSDSTRLWSSSSTSFWTILDGKASRRHEEERSYLVISGVSAGSCGLLWLISWDVASSQLLPLAPADRHWHRRICETSIGGWNSANKMRTIRTRVQIAHRLVPKKRSSDRFNKTICIGWTKFGRA